ncbi:hypothetical protein E4N71_03095 [Treponema vincentii]|uniref:Uncharacterized protein n=2 Tax=Treponema vincentii TaxID=69710 RepID=S3LRJ9_9SPIR|nr:hypothetical protein [Treponema vincentii]EEV19495.1 hypothetical protein TREVI0001_2424 [Treponema vincentii ATCC 35580]EPF47027.1 hypothetical protein HMPREF1222_00844 [Treponema vincentii F0403]UTC47279.1 hypothetical protein E4N72_08930 [Treponema vincentii]UTC49646.1 hypothetical protein E4N73_09465 [Treponema vincentii]UTC59519.1 hypothetical protein E4N70_08695 [Treponema vincentii]
MVAVQIIIAVIPIVGIVMGSVLVFFYFLWRHQQIMLQIKTNTYIRPVFNVRLFCLLLGIMLTVIGSVLFCLFYFIAGAGYILLGGLIPLALGISLTLFYTITQRSRNKEVQNSSVPDSSTEG